MPEIDFMRIRPLRDGQREAFEELCCQLARRDPGVPEGSTPRRIRGAGGDGGVEFFWTFPGGGKWGIQSKFIPELDDRKALLEDSFKQAIANHPELRRYTFCFPVQLGGPTGARSRGRGRPRLSAIEKLERWIEEWSSFADDEGVEVEIDWWDASELGNRILAADPDGGLRRYWFDDTILTEDWFARHLEDAVAQAGERYTPELSVEVPVSVALRAFGRDPNWRAGLEERRRTLKEMIEDWADNLRPGGGPDPAIPEFPDEAREEAERLRDVAARIERRIPVEDGDLIPREGLLEDLAEAIDLASRCEQSAAQALRAKYAEDWGETVADSPSFRQYMAEYQVSFPAAHVDAARDLLRELRALEAWLEGPSGRLPEADAMLIRGVAGVGKTHAIVDEAIGRQVRGHPSFVFFGEDFTTGEDPWTKVAARLGLGNSGRDELLGAMDASAEASGSVGMIFVDALNETRPDRRAWRAWLPPMVAQVARYESLKLCVSCRDSYLREVVPAGMDLPEVEHNGFAGVEFEAIQRFFEHYDLERPSAPLMQPEFTVPLFLQMVCRSLQTLGRTTLPPGMQGITAVIDLFLDASNKRTAEEIDYDPFENRVREAVGALVALMAERQTRVLAWRDAKGRVDALYPAATRSLSLFDQLARTDMLAIISGEPPEFGESERFVRFSFERIADHLLADHLLDGVGPNGVAPAFAPDGPVGFAVASDEAARSNLGLLEALAVQLPERFGVELMQAVDSVARDEILLPVSLEALVWRHPASIGGSAIDLVRSGFSGSFELLSTTLESLLALATRPDHQLNADYLHRLWRSLPLADRDGPWCMYCHRSYEEGKVVHRMIDWALRDELAGLEEETMRLWATTLAWLCAAADRRVRDRATKALVRLFLAEPAAIPPSIRRFSGVDDEYVIERVLAAAYGAVLRADDAAVTEPVAEAVWQSFFVTGSLPLNALIRDHARLILETALEASVLPGDARVEKFRPPYESPWPIEYPSEEEVAPLKERDDLPYLKLDEFGSDFAPYQIRPRVVDTFEQDAQAVYRWFLQQVVEMGYPGHAKLCAHYDADMQGRYGGGRARPSWAERIGKKYYWILLQRIVGQLSDHLPVKGFGEPLPLPSEPRLQGLELRQVDPTDLRAYRRPGRDPAWDWRPEKEYEFSETLERPDREWVSMPDFIDAAEFLSVEDPEGDAWLPLKLYKTWDRVLNADPDERYPRRHVTMNLLSVLVAEEEFGKLQEALQEASFDIGHFEPAIREYKEGFLGEYPYGSAFRLRFETEELPYRTTMLGMPVQMTTMDLMREGFEYDHSGSGDRPLLVPAPPFAGDDRLKWDGDGGWVSSRGETVFWDPQSDNRFEMSALLVRRDWMVDFLREHGLVLLWSSFQQKTVVAISDRNWAGRHMQHGAVGLVGGELSPLGTGHILQQRDDADGGVD